MDNKGVSEVLGYILIFGMVTFALTIVYMNAMPQIQSQQEYACFKSMESTFMTLKTVSELVAFNITPSKTVNLRIDNGILYTTDKINVSIEGVTANALVYEIGSNRIILLADTIFECFGDDCIVISKPRASNVNGHAYVSLINFSGSFTLSGSGAITLSNNGSEVINLDRHSINITFNSENRNLANNLAEAFNTSLKEQGFSTIHADNNVTIQNINGVIVCLHNVTVS